MLTRCMGVARSLSRPEAVARRAALETGHWISLACWKPSASDFARASSVQRGDATAFSAFSDI